MQVCTNRFTPNYCIHGACVGDGELVVRGTGRWSDLGPDLLAVQSNRGGCAVDCWQCSLFCCPFSPSVGGAVRSVLGNAVHQSAVRSVGRSARPVGGAVRSVDVRSVGGAVRFVGNAVWTSKCGLISSLCSLMLATQSITTRSDLFQGGAV